MDAQAPESHGDRHVAMANQIAMAFRTLPEAEARAAIAKHIGTYWTRAMRTRIAELAADPQSGLDANVRAAFAG